MPQRLRSMQKRLLLSQEPLKKHTLRYQRLLN